MDLKKLLNMLNKESNKKNIINIVILALIGVLLLIGSSFFKSTNAATYEAKLGDKKVIQPEVNKNAQEQELENKLKNVLSQTEGVGRVEVMLYFESGEEQVPAVNINDSISTTQEKDNAGGTRDTTQKNNGSNVVITNTGDKSEPLIVKTYKPRITGVYIVAEGAEERVTQLRITQAVVKLFNISENKVSVYPMKK